MTMVRKILVFGMALTLLTAGLAYGAEPIKLVGAAAVRRRPMTASPVAVGWRWRWTK